MTKNSFVFHISLSVLNHLGRNLYRSFTTILGEAISNSWDADAHNVYIDIDRKNNSLTIRDDGHGMTEDDFQNKFLKIGYSKRKEGKSKSPGKRPFIGRKGIGKLALLSCASKITIFSKRENSKKYTGGTINNSKLDSAIQEDLHAGQYTLEELKDSDIPSQNFNKGTVIKFQDLNNGIANSDSYLMKILALYFRFSLIDNNFSLYLNGDKVTYENLNGLAKNTQFLWIISNAFKDPYIKQFRKRKDWEFKKKKIIQKSSAGVTGFIASVGKPRDLAIDNMEERVSIDLFVNGRLRDKNILRHTPTSRIVENYLYGQIHYNDLDDNDDRFTSDREGVVANDSKYNLFLKNLRPIIDQIIKDWDNFRREEGKDGDPENKDISVEERKAEELSNAVVNKFNLPDDPKTRLKTKQWLEEVKSNSGHATASYTNCFILENLFRKYIKHKKISLDKRAKEEVKKFKGREDKSKKDGNIKISIRAQHHNDLGYLGLEELSRLVGPQKRGGSIATEAKAYKPIRNAIMHTAALTKDAKKKLETTHANMKGGLEELLQEDHSTEF